LAVSAATLSACSLASMASPGGHYRTVDRRAGGMAGASGPATAIP